MRKIKDPTFDSVKINIGKTNRRLQVRNKDQKTILVHFTRRNIKISKKEIINTQSKVNVPNLRKEINTTKTKSTWLPF